ncbi:beta-hydroxyacyl-ACP dehydratase [Crenobacter sp. SG2303]|uniref:Beta-hydroxyacyl-ACP dehydratase n=1 Tax=Crenobacter oryzisoli TaxID=3056844 RepID=A0ABT7XJ09_9NEIS|nr:beta-hydroxyacyl-ACP dehydratase [Crenobacter sp. SG2303]MDN0073554.1 beta-hydroxyacyl-ACP dehydratase [Crenobacter sp. SG2303]
MQQLPLPVAADHSAYLGHFPSSPVLPEVVLLDHAALAIEDACRLRLDDLLPAKFHRPVGLGQALRLEFRHDQFGVTFAIFHQQDKVADGKFAIAKEQAA